MILYRIFDGYLLRSLTAATVFTALTLAAIILLTQSLRFLELVINSGASSISFFVLTLLALPRFFEIILPIALMIATVFIYNRMSMDSEIVVLRAAGLSPMRLARPALLLATAVTVLLLFITTWLAPVSLAGMQNMRQVIKAQYSTLLFREGVFNTVGQDLTVYIGGRNANGELESLLIHDNRPELDFPVTIIARRGIIVTNDERQQVLVFDGSRQEFNVKTRTLNRLDFERYSIDLPEGGPIRQRWKEPDERTLAELLNPDPDVQRDMDNIDVFLVAAQRRLVSPFLALTYTAIALACLLLGPVDRRGQGWRILFSVLGVIIIQGLYLGTYSLATHDGWGLGMMYVLVFLPLGACLFILSSRGEILRRRLFLQGGRYSV